MTGRGKMTTFIYRSILKWLSLMTDHEFWWLTLMTDHNFRKLLQNNLFLQPLVSTESINHVLHFLRLRLKRFVCT